MARGRSGSRVARVAGDGIADANGQGASGPGAIQGAGTGARTRPARLSTECRRPFDIEPIRCFAGNCCTARATNRARRTASR